jgi:hypothetical protein
MAAARISSPARALFCLRLRNKIQLFSSTLNVDASFFATKWTHNVEWSAHHLRLGRTMTAALDDLDYEYASAKGRGRIGKADFMLGSPLSIRRRPECALPVSCCRPGRAGPLQKPRRFRQETSFQDRIASFAKTAHEVAALLPPGAERERDELLRKARRADTATHLKEWADSPGLRAPTR